jgi:hypothetical protein
MQKLISRIPDSYSLYNYALTFLQKSLLSECEGKIIHTLENNSIFYRPHTDAHYRQVYHTNGEFLGITLNSQAGVYRGLYNVNGQLVGVSHAYCHEPMYYLFERKYDRVRRKPFYELRRISLEYTGLEERGYFRLVIDPTPGLFRVQYLIQN